MLSLTRKMICALILCVATSITQADSQSTPPLWAPDTPVPSITELIPLQQVEFHSIKARVPEVDGYNWLHGVALVWHKGKLYTSFGHNKGKENTGTEEARGAVSSDGGKTWSDVFTIDAAIDSDLAMSHGVFLSHKGTLWAFMGCFYGKRKDIHMRAYRLNENTNTWDAQGVIAEDGFWPMDQPTRMDNGNWIIGGLKVGGVNPAAVAISHGDNLLKWDVIEIPRAPEVNKLWGESTVLVEGPKITNISRYGAKSLALISRSTDYGRTWSLQCESNLPMITSKPYCETLSNGQRILVCSSASDIKGRTPLTIAVSDAGESTFSRIYTIRGNQAPKPSLESANPVRLSYPYAIEHNGKLYIGYSNDGGRGHNQNSAEMAIVPIKQLQH